MTPPIDSIKPSFMIHSIEYCPVVADPISLLFIHGSGCDTTTWDPVVDAFADDRRVVLIDLRGHGKSPIGHCNFTIEQMVQDIEDVVQARMLNNFVIVGHSMGVRLGIGYAIRHPEKVKGLILEDLTVLPRPKDKFSYVDDPYFLEEEKDFEADYHRRHILNEISGSAETIESFSCLENMPLLLLKAETDSFVTQPGLDLMQEMQPAMKVVEIPSSYHSIHDSRTGLFIMNVNKFIEQL